MRKVRLTSLGTAGFLLLAGAAVAQQGSSSNPPTPPNPPNSSTSTQSTTQTTDIQQQNGDDTQSANAPATGVPSPAFPVDAAIHPAGRAVGWLGTATPLHVGPISLASVDYVNIYDQFYPAGGGPSDIERLNMVRANIVFDKMFLKNRIVLQFTPVLADLNGSTHGNAGLDNSLTFGTLLELTPQLSLTLRNQFADTKTRQLFPNDLLQVDEQTGGVIQGYFLEFNGTQIQNTFTPVLNYKVTPRWTLTLSPGYTYLDTYNPLEEFRIHDSVNTLGLTYQLSPSINIGGIETVEVMVPIWPVSTTGLFETTGLFYSQQLAKTLWFNGRLGGESAKYPGFNGTTWAVSGSGSLLKTFGTSDVAFAYYRGSTLTNFLTNEQVEHADLSYAYHILNRLRWSNGIGYFHTTGAQPHDAGKYGMTSLQFMFAKGFSFNASYTRRNQTSTNPLLLSGDRNTFVLGLKWEAAAAAR